MINLDHPLIQAHIRKDESLLRFLYSEGWGWSGEPSPVIFYKLLAQIIDEEIMANHKPREKGTAETFLYDWAFLDRQIDQILYEMQRFPFQIEQQVFEAQLRTYISAIQLLVFTVIGARCEVIRVGNTCMTILEVENGDRSTRGMYGRIILPPSFLFLAAAMKDPSVKKRR